MKKLQEKLIKKMHETSGIRLSPGFSLERNFEEQLLITQASRIIRRLICKANEIS
jgi:hypothetical protein